MDPAVDTLADALARHQIDLAPDVVAQLDRYCRVLWEWNEKINLTRHTDYEKFVARDVVDSLALEQFLDAGERVLDVGAGGGVPGVVLAITRPDLAVTLCDSVAKKARTLGAIVAELGMNTPVLHEPVTQVLQHAEFDTLVARAVAPLAKLLTWVENGWDSFHRFLVIKGPAWVEERREARERGLFRHLELRKLASYPLPGAQTESVILGIERSEKGDG
jgi:16S rRNA (guanine527-N7)-methyltransferase